MKKLKALFSRYIVLFISFILFIAIAYTWYRIHSHTNDICSWISENINDVSHTPILSDHPDFIFHIHQTKTSIIDLLFAGMGIIVTYIAFYIQYSFNKRQKDDLTMERFENNFFHFLDVYRNICNSTSLTNVGSGKIVFHYMFYEYKALYLIFQNRNKKRKKKWTKFQINNLAFTYFINGISQDLLLSVNEPLTISQRSAIQKTLLTYQKKSEEGKDEGITYLKDYMSKSIKYFDGHRFRLIPYLKYIFMIIDHILSSNGQSEQKKLDTIRYLSCEMTEHEIGLIYAYIHCTTIDKKYTPYLNKLFKELPADSAHKFKFDSENFIEEKSIMTI